MFGVKLEGQLGEEAFEGVVLHSPDSFELLEVLELLLADPATELSGLRVTKPVANDGLSLPAGEDEAVQSVSEIPEQILGVLFLLIFLPGLFDDPLEEVDGHGDGLVFNLDFLAQEGLIVICPIRTEAGYPTKHYSILNNYFKWDIYDRGTFYDL